MASKATLLKEEGNRFFAQKDFKSAERLYTEAIARETSDPTLFTNRAFARLELKAWEDVITDCLSALELSPNNMKAFYYLAQAQIHLNHPNEALVSALTAYEYSLRNNSPSTGKISALVLKAKKEKWAARENERLARKGDLLAETEEGLRALARGDTLRRQQLMAQGLLSAEAEEQSRINSEKEVGRKIEELRSIFAISNPFKPERREVPDYMIDNISFSIMHDPVVTIHGHSYDRATLVEHLRNSPTDPLTREPLRVQDLRPNLALKQACNEFIEENGWAVDW